MAHDGPPADDENTISQAAVYLNERLPKTRIIAQALIVDERGRPLVCELVYKKFWDLPGGVVDPHESPAHAVVRELKEELGVDATITGLRVTSWLPPWRGWDDAMLFVFEARINRDLSDFVLQHREIAGVYFLDEVEFDDRLASYTARVVRRALAAREAGEFGVYLENGEHPEWP